MKNKDESMSLIETAIVTDKCKSEKCSQQLINFITYSNLNFVEHFKKLHNQLISHKINAVEYMEKKEKIQQQLVKTKEFKTLDNCTTQMCQIEIKALIETIYDFLTKKIKNVDDKNKTKVSKLLIILDKMKDDKKAKLSDVMKIFKSILK